MDQGVTFPGQSVHKFLSIFQDFDSSDICDNGFVQAQCGVELQDQSKQ